MKIVPIFAPYLYVVKYPDDFTLVWNDEINLYFDEDQIGDMDEFDRLFSLWSNPLYLENFFNSNEEYLNASYWQKYNTSPENLSKLTSKKALDFEKEILKKQSQPNELFQPLHNDNSRLINISEGKAKYNWLRIYAVKIDENRFLIVGGAIKLTFKMGDHKCTRDELKKIANIKNILIENNIIDGDSFDDALYEINL